MCGLPIGSIWKSGFVGHKVMKNMQKNASKRLRGYKSAAKQQADSTFQILNVCKHTLSANMNTFCCVELLGGLTFSFELVLGQELSLPWHGLAWLGHSPPGMAQLLSDLYLLYACVLA